MRKLLLFTLIFVTIMNFTFARDKIISPKELPEAVQNFLQKNFPNSAVKYAEKEFSEYEVHLEDGTEISIRKNADWESIKSRNPIPNTLLPKAAAEYISTEYPEDFIREIEKNLFDYEVELSSGWELRFKTDGSFSGILDFDD